MRPHPLVGVVLLSALCWAGILWCCGCFSSSAPVLAPAIETRQDPTPIVVKLEIPVEPRSLVYLVDLPTGWGSCVPIHRWRDFTVFVTCKHVVDAAAGQPFRIVVGATPVPVVRVEVHPDLDVALLLVQVQVPIVEMDVEPVRFGDHVFASGWTMMRHMLTDGYVSADDTCSASIFLGMSGGGLFRNGKLVGIIEAVGMHGVDTPFGGFGVPVTFIHIFTPISRARSWIEGILPR